MDCLRIRNLALEREKNGARFTLLVPDLALRPGQALGIVGQSGCGKSTLLDILALILRPGRAEEFTCALGGNGRRNLFSATDNTLASIRGRDIGYVLQSGGLLSFLSVRANILLPGKLLGLRKKTLLERMDFLTQRLGITDQLDKKPQHLSGGQRQRAAIARALIHSPGLVLADEPTAAVDRETAADIFAIFRDMAKLSGVTQVVVSHDAPLLRRFSDLTAGFSLEKTGGNSVVSTLVSPNAGEAA
ncbi:MAG: ATP-binding cassette domain-containing protein [Deltaproteobacteria bacterium]|nr:ATP-binding cassette domain-containing protein [Deltaproteobacteria bacterium]